MKKYVQLLLYLICMCKNIRGQDVVFTNFFVNRVALNPAFAGDDGGGKIRIASACRNQYPNNKAPYHANNLAADYGICNTKIGVGFLAGNEILGDGFLRTNSIGGVIRIRKNITPSCYTAFGFQLSAFSQQVDWNKFAFSNQPDPVYGIKPTFSSQYTRATQMDMNVGWLIKFWDWKHLHSLGINLCHAPFRTKIGYLRNYRLPVRISLQYGYFYKPHPNITDNAKEVQIRIDQQEHGITSIFNLNWYLNEQIAIGAGLRACFFNNLLKNTQYLLLSLIFQPSQNFKIICGYEAGIDVINNYGGGNCFELGLVFIPPFELKSYRNTMRCKHYSKSRSMACPVFSKAKIIASF